jgi:aspartyl-tRNA(Asn)/glutamyl-tRNA(Gln) amidotransferase subunit C
MITEAEIRKLAHLARLGLTDQEVTRYASELSEILDFFELLQELDTNEVTPVNQITEVVHQTRADEVIPADLAPKLIESTPNDLENQQIKVKNVF